MPCHLSKFNNFGPCLVGQKKLGLATVALSFVFDNFCVIMD